MHPYQFPYHLPSPYSTGWFEGSGYAGAFRTPGSEERIVLRDYGQKPFAANINEAAKQNKTFRTAFWT
ncbi:cupin domain-containing protein, partial [Bacillus haynesii]|nr:cupin domain-containing protein [Bacillus haynesii]